MTDSATNQAKETGSAETEQQEQTVIDDTIITTGSLSRKLRACREEADLDIEQAAHEMRLPVGVLKALENEHFSDLPEPPYVRGYLRSYARLNDSDPNDLIRRYETLRGANPDDATSFKPNLPLNKKGAGQKSSVSSGTLKLAGLALFVLLLGVLSMIPAISQWVNETWTSFAAKTEATLVTTEQADSEQPTPSGDTSTDTTSTNDSDTETVSADEASTDSETTAADTESLIGDNASSQDTPEIEEMEGEQLAPNNSDTSENTQAEITTDNEPSDGVGQAPEQTTETQADSTDGDVQQTQATAAEADGSAGDADKLGQTQTSAEETPEESGAGETDVAESESVSDANTGNETEQTAVASEQGTDNQQAGQDESASDSTDQVAVSEDMADIADAENDGQNAQQDSAATTETIEQSSQQQLAQENTARNQQQATTNTTQQPVDGNVHVRMDFTQNCWMSIKDARGKSVFAELNAPGARREIRARTPLNFKVGNAAGVRIYINGQLIDQNPHTRANVSTFRISQ